MKNFYIMNSLWHFYCARIDIKLIMFRHIELTNSFNSIICIFTIQNIEVVNNIFSFILFFSYSTIYISMHPDLIRNTVLVAVNTKYTRKECIARWNELICILSVIFTTFTLKIEYTRLVYFKCNTIRCVFFQNLIYFLNVLRLTIN